MVMYHKIKRLKVYKKPDWQYGRGRRKDFEQ